MIQYLYLGRVGYDEGLSLQAEIAGLLAEGCVQNVLLLLEHPPVLTLGRNADRANVLASDELLARRGVTLHEINRGGDVTYHGPGQLVGYPIFDLRSLRNPNGGRMGPVDFVRLMEEALIRLCGGFGVRAGRIAGLTGVWCGVDTGIRDQPPQRAQTARWGPRQGSGVSNPTEETVRHQTASAGTERKIGAIGIHVSRGITSHGFAFNVTTDLRDFELIIPCGIPDHAVTSLEREFALDCGIARPEELPGLERVAHQAARQFGVVFDQQVLAVESLAALRAEAEAALPAAEFPAEDTPMQVPAEVERLRGNAAGPARVC
jgi:lipoyl(octanoyl) transferase